MSACVHVRNKRYLGYLLNEFDHTFTTNGLWSKDECVKFWGQKVKSQIWGQICLKIHFFGFLVGGGIIVDRVVTTIWFK